ncbi:MAG: hypothetical protein K2I33_04845, partial [Oscillospiraceae bacterium]|nr:hypothetical protein [Oscillospiraceae bacterium]
IGVNLIQNIHAELLDFCLYMLAGGPKRAAGRQYLFLMIYNVDAKALKGGVIREGISVNNS